MRDRAGKEVRVPILLSAAEKQISWKVSAAFQQTICGFDLLRTVHGRSYVCDVNGFSFVKSSTKYHDDCAQVLRRTILKAIAPDLLHARRVSVAHRTPPFGPATVVTAGEGSPRDPAGDAAGASTAAGASSAAGTGGEPGPAEDEWDGGEAGRGDAQPEYSAHYMSQYPVNVSADDEELRCVLAVMRHGDRTPKQKMKMKVRPPPSRAAAVRSAHTRHAAAPRAPGVTPGLPRPIRPLRGPVEAAGAQAEERAAAQGGLSRTPAPCGGKAGGLR